MNRRTWRLAVAAVAVTALAMGTAHAAERPSFVPFKTLTLRGDTTAYVDVDLREDVVPYGFHARPKVGGSYAGFVAQRLDDGQIVSGEVWVPAFYHLFHDRAGTLDEGAGQVYGMVRIYGEADWSVPKRSARYRFYLLADGPAEVVIELAYASTARTLRPAHRRSALVRVVDMGGSPGGERRVGFTGTPTTLAVAASAWANREFGLYRIRSCLRKDESSCPAQLPPEWPEVPELPLFGHGYGFQEAETWPQGFVPAGPVNAVMLAQGFGVDGRGMGFFLALDVAI